MASERVFVATRLVSLLMSQSIVLILVYYLDAAEFGALAILLSLAQFIITLLVAWHSGTVLNHGQKYYPHFKTLYTVLVFRGSFVALLAIVLVVLVNQGVEQWVNNFSGLENGFYLLTLFVFAESAFDFCQNILVVYGKLLMNSLSILLIKTSCFFYVLFGFESLESYFELNFILHISYSVFVLICLLVLDRPAKHKVAFHKFRELSLFSFWAIFTSLSVVIANQAYNSLLRWSDVPLSDIGAHNLAFKALMSLSVLVYFVRVFYAKSLYAKDPKERVQFVRKVLERYLKNYLLLASIGYLLISILVYMLTFFLSGDAGYQNSLFYMALYLPAFILFQRAQFLAVLLNNSVCYKRENLAFIYMSLCGFVANLLLINIIGVYGVVLGTTLGYLVFNLLIKRYMNLSFYLTFRKAN